MRAIRWSFILFQFFWLNVALPGHTRGAITVPGSTASREAKSGSSCCSSKSQKHEKDSPTPREKACCAICYFAMGMSTPPVVVFNHNFFGLLTTLPIPPPERAESHCLAVPFDGRAPPSV